nr:serine/threonine-protein kinase [Tritonibacter litoralis]
MPFGHSLLQGQYRIERELMAGGFGITYLARDSLDRQMVIKECFPAGFCTREGAKVATHSPYRAKSFKNVLRHFLREAQWLARAQHDNIVAVHQVFKENGTAYIAMDYVSGCDLVTLRERDPGRLDQSLMTWLMEQSLQALSVLHAKGILHRDISPDNFLIDAKDHLTLIDFGSAGGTHGDADTALGAMLSVKDGYSPHEFYQPDMPQRFSSDLYALGATFHFLVTGQPPAHAQARLKAVTAGFDDPCPLLEEGDWPFDPAFLRAIDKAMSILPGMRFQSAGEWAECLPEPEVREEVAGDTSAQAAPTLVPEENAPDMPAAEPVAAVISDLVASTNRALEQRSARRGPKVEEAPKPKKPTQMVDLFGEPIGDVDRWLEAQDQQARGQVPTARARTPEPAAKPVNTPPKTQADTPLPRNRDSGWVDRVARIWGGGEPRLNKVTMNGKTT